jgi:glycosyltransferase involved in cell wall biosynthesis
MKTLFSYNNFFTELRDRAFLDEEKNLKKISIVMPSYNKVDFIERSILSVLNQNYPSIELIIIDGGSTDGTIEIIRKYEQYITFWISEKDQGQSDALNKGFKYCTGSIYGFLNSDDVYLPDAFNYSSLVLEKNIDIKVVFGDWLSIDKKDAIIDYNHAFDFNLNHFKYEGFHLSATSMFWRSEIHKRFSGFDNNLYYTMDYQLILEFGINEGEYSFKRVPKALAGFRRYKGQKTESNMDPGVIKEHKLMAERYGYSDKYKFIGKLKRFYFRIRRAWWYIRRGGISNLISRLKTFYVNRVSVKF